MNKYNTVEAHIDYVRRRLKQDSDDSHFTDEEIYKALIDSRARIIYQRAKNGKQYSEWMYQTVCVKLCIETFNDCNCVPDGLDCKILKTEITVPKPLYNGYQDILRVSTINGNEISASTLQASRFRKYKKTGKTKAFYVVINEKIAVFGIPQNRLRAIMIRGLFEDPATAGNISICPDGTTDCTEFIGTGFASEANENMAIYESAMKMLLQTLQMPDDRSNNAESVTPQTKI